MVKSIIWIRYQKTVKIDKGSKRGSLRFIIRVTARKPGSSRDNNNFIRDIRNLEKVNRKENTKIKQRN